MSNFKSLYYANIFYFKLYMNNKRACEIFDTKTRTEIEEKINLLVYFKKYA